MQLSDPLKPYVEKTCILVTDRLHATSYLAHLNQIDPLETYTNDRLTLDDPERYMTSVAGTHYAKGVDEGLDDREAQGFFRTLAHALLENFQKGNFTKLILVVPHPDMNIFVDTLDHSLKSLIEAQIPKELIHTPLPELCEIIDKVR